jgi:hypothetical protein
MISIECVPLELPREYDVHGAMSLECVLELDLDLLNSVTLRQSGSIEITMNIKISHGN